MAGNRTANTLVNPPLPLPAPSFPQGVFEAANKYRVFALPPGTHAARVQNEPGAWLPTARDFETLPEMYVAQESSSCCLRVVLAILGGLNLRKLTLFFAQRDVGRRVDVSKYRVDRPCLLGGCCCCPLAMTLNQLGPDGSVYNKLGEVVSARAATSWGSHSVLDHRDDRPPSRLSSLEGLSTMFIRRATSACMNCP